MSQPAPSTANMPELVLFTFPESVFGRRMVRYLNLRGLPFTQIRVPPNMPRPLLHEKLGINYRRIPILASGRDVYIDTRLILAKLESLIPEGKLSSDSPFESGFVDMFEQFIIDGGPFWRTAGCIPLSAPLVQDEVWMKDRFDGSGGAFTKEALQRDRAWNLSQVRLYFRTLEKLLADGRKWVLDGAGPGLAEIHAGWIAEWAIGMASDPSAPDISRLLSREKFPYVYAWVERFQEATAQAESANAGAGRLAEGSEADADCVARILRRLYAEPSELTFDANDVLELKQGQVVSLSPVDFGFNHADVGPLVGLSENEVVIESAVPGGKDGNLRVHYPRINFKISPVDGSSAS